MSWPVALAFRHELATAFAAELGERVFDLVNPPEQRTPLATYRCLRNERQTPVYRRAQIQVTLRDPAYSTVKELQKRIEQHFAGKVRTWMGKVDAAECRVWVYSIDAASLQDAHQPSTRLRVVKSEFVVRYADVMPA